MTLSNFLLIYYNYIIQYQDIFLAFFIIFTLIYGFVIFKLMKSIKEKSNEIKILQQQYLARVDNIRKEHSETLERLRQEMVKREEERTRQWIESEKETLHVLNGVSNILDLKEKLDHSDSMKIMKKLDEIYNLLNNNK